MAQIFFTLIVSMLLAIFPLVVVVAVNVFCLRIAKEVAPREEHHGSIITSPLLYLYFLCVFPITLIITWFPIGLSLLFLYGEDSTRNLVLPTSMNEQMLAFITIAILMTVIVAGFSIRAGELYRIPLPPGGSSGGGYGKRDQSSLQSPAGMLSS